MLLSDCELLFIYRKLSPALVGDSLYVEIGDLRAKMQWAPYLQAVDVVVHTAAIAHSQGRVTEKLQPHFDEVNVQATLTLARQAAEAGVKRFVFLSTVKVLGEGSSNQPFCVDSKPRPMDFYACRNGTRSRAWPKLSMIKVWKSLLFAPP